jgi:hypothetical protein
MKPDLKLFLYRFKPLTKGYQAGKLYVDGDLFCHTLEDEVREVEGQPVEKWKIKGKTAIPRGKYRVDVTFSNRFKTMMPILLDVPGFEGVRIHAGNTSANTEGCVLVGNESGEDGFLGDSRTAFANLFGVIKDAINSGQDVWLTI